MTIEEFREHVRELDYCFNCLESKDKPGTYFDVDEYSIKGVLDVTETVLSISRILKSLSYNQVVSLDLDIFDSLTFLNLIDRLAIIVFPYHKFNDRILHESTFLPKFVNDIACGCVTELRRLPDENIESEDGGERIREVFKKFSGGIDTIYSFIVTWLDIAEKAINEFIGVYGLRFHDKCKRLLADEYYDYLESHEGEIKDELCNCVFQEGILTALNAQPEQQHYAALLQQLLKDDPFDHEIPEEYQDKGNNLLKTTFSYAKALNIEDDCYMDYLLSIDSMKIDNFFHQFAMYAILQAKVRPCITILRHREVEVQEVEPLPDCFSSKISNNKVMNRKLREIIAEMSPHVGKSGSKMKWSHVKHVMQDEGIIIGEVKPTEFGDAMAKICTTIIAGNCRKNVDNNPILERGKYTEWPTTAKHKRACDDVAQYLKPIIDFLK